MTLAEYRELHGRARDAWYAYLQASSELAMSQAECDARYRTFLECKRALADRFDIF